MIAVGVDTHKHEHLARALDGLGQLVGGVTIKADPAGYLELADWLADVGEDVVVVIEGTGTYGAGLCEFLLASGIHVVEVERPRREERRRGKSDEIDALLAAKKVLAGDGLSTPRAGGTRQALSALLVAYRSCMVERTRVLNQLQALHTSAPWRYASGSAQATAESSLLASIGCGPVQVHQRHSSSSSACCATSAPAPTTSRFRPAPTSASSPA